MVLAPLLLILAAEAGLRIVGWGYPTGFCLSVEGGTVCVDNGRFLYQFYSPGTNLRPNPFRLVTPKPAGTVRVVVLGESAAMGTPDPAYGLSRFLQAMMLRQFPGKRIEVVNAAVRGINSHIIRAIASDCARLEPDLYVVYMGNNEAVGLHAPGPGSGFLIRHLSLLRAIQAARSSRIGQVLAPAVRKWSSAPGLVEEQDADFFRKHRLAADDPRRVAVFENFERNLQDILESCTRCGAKVLLATVPVNEADCPPLGSLHREGLTADQAAAWERSFDDGVRLAKECKFEEASRSFQAALALDDHYAELHFRLAQCDVAQARWDAARDHFSAARDWDAMPFRAGTASNRIVKDLAAAWRERGVMLADVAAGVARSALSPHGIPGDALFYDHVHTTFAGTHLVASELMPGICEALGSSVGAARLAGKLPSVRECAGLLGYGVVAEAQARAAMIKMMAAPPFTEQFDHAERQARTQEALKASFGGLSQKDVDDALNGLKAVSAAAAAKDWHALFNLARLHMTFGKPALALEHYDGAFRLMPHYLPGRLGLANALFAVGRVTEAERLVEEALTEDPKSRDALAAMAQIRGNGGLRANAR